MSDLARFCPTCGAKVTSMATGGLCPRCLLERAVQTTAPPQPRPPGAPAVGTHIGDYELLVEIAHGGMGVVFKARQLSLNRFVALKMIRAAEFASEGELRRFRLEAEAVAQLDHPNIVPIYEVGEHDGQPFFTMKFIGGGSLAERIAGENASAAESSQAPCVTMPSAPRGRGCDLPGIARLLATTARAVHYAHQRGILHRDLKPGNILLDEQGEPQVTDFGLARHLSSNSSLTLSGAIVGTPGYMAPELASGHSHDATVAADVHSLGAILYELLARRPPFEADTPLETMRKVVEDEPVPPSRCATDETRLSRLGRISRAMRMSEMVHPVDRDLEIICLKCLEKDPKCRYASAEALADDLEHWLRHEPIRARPSTAWESAVKWAKRRPAQAGLVGVSVGAASVLLAVLLVAGAQVADQRNRAVKQERIIRTNLYAADISLAQRLLDEGDLDQARRVLAEHWPNPSTPSSELATDLRGFEWRHLWRRCEGNALATLRGHTGAVTCLAFSSDGTLLFSGSRDGTVKRWDVSARQDLETLSLPEPVTAAGVQKEIFSLALSPDGRTLAVGTETDVGFWDAKARRWKFTVPSGKACVAFLPGGTRVAIGSRATDDSALLGTVRLYDLPASNDAGTVHQPVAALRHSGGLVAVSRDGKALATGAYAESLLGSSDLHVLKLWDVVSGRLLATNAVDGLVNALAISPDGRLLATSQARTASVRFWDLASNTFVGKLDGLEGWIEVVRHLAFAPDGQTLATAGEDNFVRLWNVVSRRERARLDGHTAPVNAVAFTPRGELIASAGDDQTVRLWHPFRQSPVEAMIQPENLRSSFVMSSEGGRVAAALRDQGIVIWNLTTLESGVLPNSHAMCPLAFVARDRELVAQQRAPDGEIQLNYLDLSTHSNRLSVALPQPYDVFDAAALSPDGRLLAVLHEDVLTLWDIARAQRLAILGTPDPFAAGGLVCFSPDGRTLAAAGSRGGAQIYDVPAGQLRARLPQVVPLLASVAFSADSRLLFAGIRDHTIRIWEVATGREIGALTGHKQNVHSVAISPDGSTLASASLDGTLRLWSLATRRPMVTLRNDAPSRWMMFTPDGQALVSREASGLVGGQTLHIYRAPEPPAAAISSVLELRSGPAETSLQDETDPTVEQPSSSGVTTYSIAGPTPAVSLLGWWSGDGHSRDLSGHQHHGALQGRGAYALGVQGQAFCFLGGGDCVRIPGPLDGSLDFGLDSFTVTAWVSTTCSNSGTLVEKREIGALGDEIHVLGFQLFVLGGWLGFQWGDGSLGDLNRIPPKSARRINDGAWHHVAVTLDRSSAVAHGRLYVDGEPYYAFTSRLRGRLNPSADLFIGDYKRPFAACLDEVKLFHGAVGPGEIQRLHRDSASSPPER